MNISYNTPIIIFVNRKKTIKAANDEGDTTTRRLFEKILAEEEEHIDTFGKLLVGLIPLSDPEI